jgi:hypothetical protein
MGFRHGAAWIATGLAALAMTVRGILFMSLVGFMVRVQFQPHRNRQLAMTAEDDCSEFPRGAWLRCHATLAL